MSGSKRTAEELDSVDYVEVSTQKGPISSKSDKEVATFFRYSQNMDISDTFNLNMIDGKVYDENNQEVLYIVVNKNSKINRKLDQVLKHIKDQENTNKDSDTKEVIFIANSGNSIQKLISIVEILKQKLIQLQDYDKDNKKIGINNSFKNKTVAKLPEYDNIIISGKVVENNKIKVNYSQLNFMDYSLIEKEVDVNNKRQKKIKGKSTNLEKEGLYDKKIIEGILKVNKLVKIPVMYIYMNFHKSEELPVKYVSKIKNLMSNGWSIQQS